MSTVRALWSAWGFRDYILASVKRDFASKYLGTQLGWFWAVAQPLALIAIYTLVFAQVMKPALPGHDSPWSYSIFLCSGLLVWQLFSEILSRSVGIFVHNANLLKKVNVPRFSLPAIVALSSIANFLVVFGLFLGFLTLIGAFPGGVVAAIVPLLAIVVALALGLGVLFGTVNVFYRDIEQSATLLVSFWFWLTPIVYPARALPSWLEQSLAWNPMWPIVQYSQTIFLEARVPEPGMLVYPALVAIVVVVLGLHVFRRLSGDIVDEL